MSEVEITFRKMTVGIAFRWWVFPYLRLMAHLHHQCGVTLDIAKIQARLLKGTVLVVNGKRIPLRH